MWANLLKAGVFILIASLVGVLTSLVLQRFPVADAIYQFATTPWIRAAFTFVAAVGGVLLALYGPAVADRISGRAQQPPLRKRIWALFSLGALFVILGPAVNLIPQPESFENATFVIDINYPDDHNLEPGEQFTKGWRLYNGGTTHWQRYEVRKYDKGIAGPEGFNAPDTQAGHDAEVYALETAAPITPGCYRTRYRMFSRTQQRFFGEIFHLQIVVGPPGPKIDYPVYVGYLNVSEGTLMEPNEQFKKGWQIHNCGDNRWENYQAQRISGSLGPTSIDVPIIEPHQDLSLWAAMTAPGTPGTYQAAYRLVNASGQFIGDQFIVSIKVGDR